MIDSITRLKATREAMCHLERLAFINTELPNSQFVSSISTGIIFFALALFCVTSLAYQHSESQRSDMIQAAITPTSSQTSSTLSVGPPYAPGQDHHQPPIYPPQKIHTPTPTPVVAGIINSHIVTVPLPSNAHIHISFETHSNTRFKVDFKSDMFKDTWVSGEEKNGQWTTVGQWGTTDFYTEKNGNLTMDFKKYSAPLYDSNGEWDPNLILSIRILKVTPKHWEVGVEDQASHKDFKSAIVKIQF